MSSPAIHLYDFAKLFAFGYFVISYTFQCLMSLLFRLKSSSLNRFFLSASFTLKNNICSICFVFKFRQISRRHTRISYRPFKINILINQWNWIEFVNYEYSAKQKQQIKNRSESWKNIGLIYCANLGANVKWIKIKGRQTEGGGGQKQRSAYREYGRLATVKIQRDEKYEKCRWIGFIFIYFSLLLSLSSFTHSDRRYLVKYLTVAFCTQYTQTLNLSTI